ncbi:MAG: thioredoxin-disulfide reductase [Patescibacteria group bacterium]
MYDTIIIGSGPAGMTAGIYAARREMKALIIGKELGGQLIWASEVENYPGFKSVDNFDLITKIKEQVNALGAEIKTDEIKEIKKVSDYFLVTTRKEKFEAKTVIVAIGLSPRRLAIPGEEELTGKGVSYCANCDGPIFRDKVVAIVGGGNSALDATEVMSKIAAKVYLIHRREEFRGFEALVDEVKTRDNVELVLSSEIKEIIGKEKLEKIKVFNKKTNKEGELEIDGLFVEIGRLANTDLVKDLVKRDERNQILVDEKCKTNTEGIFAAGDVTQVPFKQITIAQGQATIAALAAYEYLQLKQGKKAVVADRSKPKV